MGGKFVEIDSKMEALVAGMETKLIDFLQAFNGKKA